MHLTTDQGKQRRGMYFRCETCGREFYVYPSDIKKAERKGNKIRYCSMACYDMTGTNNPFYGKKHSEDAIRKMTTHPNRPRFQHGEKNPNFTRFGEEFGFKGSHSAWWREKLFRDIGHCERCGFADQRALSMHHKDRNRRHNTRENLELLCWNCHAIAHWDDQSGIYHFMRRRDDDRPPKQQALNSGTPQG